MERVPPYVPYNAYRQQNEAYIYEIIGADNFLNKKLKNMLDADLLFSFGRDWSTQMGKYFT
jgi:hypothetical protein